MNTHQLIDTARTLVVDDKGLLAMDESNPTCNKRFAKLGIPQTVEARRAYRELIVTTPGLGESVSGAILYDETIRQQKKDGTPFAKALTDVEIIRGIKVDTGAKEMAGHPGEKITEGLDGLRDRLADYSRMGARFARWRAVITIGDDIPSRACIESNAQALARYAALCQEAGLVPVAEPEVLMDGEHSLDRCFEVTERVLRTVFDQLYTQRVNLEGMILKPNMVLPGLTCPSQVTVDAVADATVRCLSRAVPAARVFLREHHQPGWVAELASSVARPRDFAHAMIKDQPTVARQNGRGPAADFEPLPRRDRCRQAVMRVKQPQLIRFETVQCWTLLRRQFHRCRVGISSRPADMIRWRQHRT